MKRAFTLIELLVVIAIIAILAAILFPVFAQAKAQAKTTVCLANTKELGLGMLMYSNDNDDTFCQTWNFHFADANGNTPIEPYIKNHAKFSKSSIWVCPNEGAIWSGVVTSNNAFLQYPVTYSMNVFLDPGNQYAPDADACYTPVSRETSVRFEKSPYSNESNLAYDSSNPTHPVGGISQTAIANVAMTDMLFEAYVEDATGGYTGISPENGDYLQEMGFFPTQAEANYSWGYELEPATTPRHTATNNFIFCDGHSKGRTPETLGYDITLHPTDNIWLVHDGRDGSALPPPNSGGC